MTLAQRNVMAIRIVYIRCPQIDCLLYYYIEKGILCVVIMHGMMV